VVRQRAVLEVDPEIVFILSLGNNQNEAFKIKNGPISTY
jgi:hypothetical protein